MQIKEKLSVAVLAGGPSEEREISLRSGDAVASALMASGHVVVFIDPAVTMIDSVEWTEIDVCFIALHGTFGEDGQIQQKLTTLGVPFTGSNAEASRLAFCKSEAKSRFVSAGVPTPEFEVIHQFDSDEQIKSVANRIGFPLVVKPDQQGSSLGVSILNSVLQLMTAVQNAFQFGESVLLERAIPGTEWTVAVLGGQTLPAIQIETAGEFYDFDAKYTDDRTRYRFEFDDQSFDTELYARIAMQACQALGTSGVARVDLRVDSEYRPWVLEVNTIPGFTDHSLVPKAAVYAGMSFAEFCEKSLLLALEHHRHHVRIAG